MQHLHHRLSKALQLSKILAVALLAVSARAAEPSLPPQLEGIGIEERLGRQIDLDLEFTNERGYRVPLRSFFQKGKPVLLDLVYYSCPMLCNLVLNGQTQVLREVPWTPGNEYEIVTISINPAESFDLAVHKKESYLESYGKPAPGWHFLTDYKGNVKKLASQVGFNYRWDEKSQQFAHAAAITFLTPEGKVSRYLYGIRFKQRDVRLALTEASESKLGVTIDKILLFCFHYDPAARSYVIFARNIMRAGGVLTIFILGAILIRLWRGERNLHVPDNLVSVK
jgi:protein SCO1/2